MMKMEEKENRIRKEVKKIRIKVTIVWIIVTIVFTLLTPDLKRSLNYLLPPLSHVLSFYFVGVIFGLIGLIVRSISMLEYIDYKMMIDKYNIKYRWYEVSEQCKIIKRAYFFKYPFFIIFTILAFVSLAVLTLDNFVNQRYISLIFVSGVSLVVGFILEWPRGIS